jgi:hypothetical protein
MEGGRAAWEALSLGATDLLPRRWLRTADGHACAVRAFHRLEGGRAFGSIGCVIARSRPLRVEDAESLSALAFWAGMADLPAAARALALLGAPKLPPVLFLTPHPSRFARALREGLDRLLPGPVRVAADGEHLAPGQAFLVPPDASPRLERTQGGLVVRYMPPAIEEGARQREPRGSLLEILLEREELGAGVVLTSAPPAPLREIAARASASGRLYRLRRSQGRKASIRRVVRLLDLPARRLA